MNECIKILMIAVSSFIAYAFEGNQYIEPLLWVITIDMLSGVIASFVNPNLRFNSRKMYRGIAKKFLMLCMVAFSHQLDIMLNMNIICSTLTIYFIANDGLSVIENLAKCGITVPKLLERSLEQLHEHTKR